MSTAPLAHTDVIVLDYLAALWAQSEDLSQPEKIQMLGSSRCFTDESETITVCQGIDRTGLARVRAAGKGYLDSNRHRQVAQFADSSIKGCVLKNGHIQSTSAGRKSRSISDGIFRGSRGSSRSCF